MVKVGERAESSHAGGIVFYPLNWKTFQRKCVGGFAEKCQTAVLNSKGSTCSQEMTLEGCAILKVNVFEYQRIIQNQHPYHPYIQTDRLQVYHRRVINLFYKEL